MRECHIKGITVGPRCGRCGVTFGVKSWVIIVKWLYDFLVSITKKSVIFGRINEKSVILGGSSVNL